MESKNESKTVYRLPPCPDYDVEGMESWLSEMAQNGYHLCQDGFFCGLASFEKGSPKPMRYRLMADLQKKSWLDDDCAQEEEMAQLNEKYGWEFVAKRGDFYICRSDAVGERELNTDPEVYALAINTVCKRRRSAVISSILWVLLYPILKIRGNLLLTMVHIGTGYSLFNLALIGLFLGHSVFSVVHLSNFRKKLLNGGNQSSEQNWRSKAMRHYAWKAGKVLLVAVWICVTFAKFGEAVMDSREIPLESYTEKPPFATMTDFAPSDISEYDLQNYGFSNTVAKWQDWLSPENYRWEEIAEMHLTDGTTLDGALYIDYHMLSTPWLAEGLANEYHNWDKNKEWDVSKRDYELIGELDLGIDYSIAYYNEIHQPTVILRYGCKVIHASFSQFSENQNSSVETWAAILADSMQ